MENKTDLEKQCLNLAMEMEFFVNATARVSTTKRYLESLKRGGRKEQPNFTKKNVEKWNEVDEKVLDNFEHIRAKLFISTNPIVYEGALKEFPEDWQRIAIIDRLLFCYNNSNNSFRIDYQDVFDFLFDYRLKLNENGSTRPKVEKNISGQFDQDVCPRSKKHLTSVVESKLSETEIKKMVLSKLPKKEQRQNKKWVLSQGEVYNKNFSRDFPNKEQEGNIITYIKRFRSKNYNKK